MPTSPAGSLIIPATTSSTVITTTTTVKTPPSSPNNQLINTTTTNTTTTPSRLSSSPQSSSSSPSTQLIQQRRVKLYRLKDDSWIDLGTGHCAGVVSDQSDQIQAAWIVVSRESNLNDGKQPEILLKSRIEAATLIEDDEDDDNDEEKGCNLGAYQKQQDTLIVWTDKLTEMEMALSFATTSGCAEIWAFIKHSRRWQADQQTRSPSLSPGNLSPQSLYSFYRPTTMSGLPELSLGTINHLEAAIRNLGRTATGRERTASMIIQGGYIPRLIQVHGEAEDLESLDDLHALCRVMQMIILLNDNVVFDTILQDDAIIGVASILEYDPEFPTMKASYRTHLADPNHFIQVVPIRSPQLLAKIHQTHRLHYLKDVVLARILEDSTFSMLNSAIYFNEVDIVNEVAMDTLFLRELFGIFDEEGTAIVRSPIQSKEMIGPQLPPSTTFILASPTPLIGPILPPTLISPTTNGDELNSHTSPSLPADSELDPTIHPENVVSSPSTTVTSPPPDRRHDAILFLQQFCSMAKNLQLPLRAAFFKNLVDKGLLQVIEVALALTVEKEDSIMKAATVEILMNLVDHDPNNVRGYSLKQHAAEKRPLVVFLIQLFHKELDLGLKAQMAEALRVLVDAGGEGGPLEAPPRMRQEDPEAEKFLQYFYDHSIAILLAPILELPEQGPADPPINLSLHNVALCGHLCDLLCFFVSHHTFRSKYFVLSTSISTNIAKLFKTPHKHLRLAALRYFRACVGKNDDFYNRFLIKNGLFGGILEVMIRESGRDNLLASACLEFFEFIRSVNAKAIINHLLERYNDQIKLLAKTLSTFSALILKWEQNNEPIPVVIDSVATAPTSKSMTRERGSWSRMDLEEESYFNTPDDEDDGPLKVNASVVASTSRKREDEDEELTRKKSRLLSPDSIDSTSVVVEGKDGKGKAKGLVDYGDDEEDFEAGGFIRESLPGSDEAVATASVSIAIPVLSNALSAAPPSLPPQRRAVQEEESLISATIIKVKKPLGLSATLIPARKITFGSVGGGGGTGGGKE